MKRTYIYSSVLIGICCLFFVPLTIAQKKDWHKNPSEFHHNMDILAYLQVLYKYRQYDKMSHFFYGPMVPDYRPKLVLALSKAKFDYIIKKVDIKKLNETRWSLTYKRDVFGKQEAFKFECMLVNDTCKVYLDEKTWKTLFAKDQL